jgi:hypothetical protein
MKEMKMKWRSETVKMKQLSSKRQQYRKRKQCGESQLKWRRINTKIIGGENVALALSENGIISIANGSENRNIENRSNENGEGEK